MLRDYFPALYIFSLTLGSKRSPNVSRSFNTTLLAIDFNYIYLLLLGLLIIGAHRQNPPDDKFRVPLVPLVPGLSILFNIGLICHLSSLTWLRFLVWMVVGKL